MKPWEFALAAVALGGVWFLSKRSAASVAAPATTSTTLPPQPIYAPLPLPPAPTWPPVIPALNTPPPTVAPGVPYNVNTPPGTPFRSGAVVPNSANSGKTSIPWKVTAGVPAAPAIVQAPPKTVPAAKPLSGSLTSSALARLATVAPSTGPATEARSGIGHF